MEHEATTVGEGSIPLDPDTVNTGAEDKASTPDALPEAERQVLLDLFADLDLLQRPVEAAPIPSDEDLLSIATLALYLKKLDQKILDAAAGLKSINEERNRVVRKLIPDALEKAGMRMFGLIDGSEVAIENKLFASISAANQPEAFEWLIETGSDDLIKTVVKVEFGRGELTLAQTFLEALRGRWASRKVTATQSVNPQSLSAHVRALEEAGQSFPEEALGVHRVTEAVIREPKAAKAPKGSKSPKAEPTEDEEF